MCVMSAESIAASYELSQTHHVSQRTPNITGHVSLARSQEDLTQAFRLLYNSYTSAGLATSNALQMHVTPYHALPTTEVFVAKVADQVVATMTMTAENPYGLPMDTMYERELAPLKGAKHIAEMGCFADRRESPTRFMRVFSELARIVVQVAQARGIGGLVLATHPRHAKFYVRTLGFQQFGGLKSCPYAQGKPAIALVMDFEQLQGTDIHQRLFGVPIDSDQLASTQWSSPTREYLQWLCQHQYPEQSPPTRIAG